MKPDLLVTIIVAFIGYLIMGAAFLSKQNTGLEVLKEKIDEIKKNSITPEQLERKHREILQDVEEKFVLIKQYEEMKELFCYQYRDLKEIIAKQSEDFTTSINKLFDLHRGQK